MIESAELRATDLARENEELRTALRESVSREGYWWRRAEFAELALQPFGAIHERVQNVRVVEGAKLMVDPGDCAMAHTVLAERRKGHTENYEDLIRNRRQTKMLRWCYTAFAGVDDARLQSSVERALRFQEEATELTHAVICNAMPTESRQSVWDQVRAILNRVIANPPGPVPKEGGQVALTLGILAEHEGFSVAEEERREFERVLTVSPATHAARWSKKIAEGL